MVILLISLAVPFVDYFDDEFWSDQASLEKLKMIISAHQEVFLALKKFTQEKGKLTYVIGNHDAELALKLERILHKIFDGNIELIDLTLMGIVPFPMFLSLMDIRKRQRIHLMKNQFKLTRMDVSI